jgi:hypothetical protein
MGEQFDRFAALQSDSPARVIVTSQVPTDLLVFLRRTLHSVWALDLLMLIRRTPERSYSVRELATELRASDAVVNGILPVFLSEGLMTEVERGRFTYRPSETALAEKVDRLADTYRTSPVAIVREIALAPSPKLQDLADAFRFKKD